MGNVAGEVPMRNARGINVVGGSFPARIWSAYMAAALALLAVQSFLPPDPSHIPAPLTLVDGQPRPPARLPFNPGSHTAGTTWCSASCNQH